jgi:hypothetical protein
VNGEDTTALTPREDDDEDELGTRFFLKLGAGILGVGILVLIGLLVFWRALYAWGFFGAFALLAAIAIVSGWIYDRRNPRS